jgi:DNA-binding CsgD family transcriptional regulator
MEPVNERTWVDDRMAAAQRGLRPTPRQIGVFLAVLRLTGNSEAAHELGLSVQTVKNHVGHLLARLGARNMAEAAALLWWQYPDLRERMVLPHDELGQRHDRRGGQRRR